MTGEKLPVVRGPLSLGRGTNVYVKDSDGCTAYMVIGERVSYDNIDQDFGKVEEVPS